MSSSTPALPGAVRWARGLCVFFGALLALSAAGLAFALVALPPPVAARTRNMVPISGLFAVCAFGLLWAAVGIRERSRWGWRAGIAAYAALVLVDLSGLGGGRRVGLNTLLMLIGLSTLLAPPTRRWFNTTEEEVRATEAEDRNIRRAQRRLTEDAPSLRDISFRDLPRRDHR